MEWVAATRIANYLNTFQISVKCIVYTQFLDANVPMKNTVFNEEWMAAVLSWNKETLKKTLKKNFPATKYSNLHGKTFF